MVEPLRFDAIRYRMMREERADDLRELVYNATNDAAVAPFYSSAVVSGSFSISSRPDRDLRFQAAYDTVCLLGMDGFRKSVVFTGDIPSEFCIVSSNGEATFTSSITPGLGGARYFKLVQGREYQEINIPVAPPKKRFLDI